jgi:probable S-adenosylmethionine-dependent methyltransferase, YraL family
MGTLYIVATPIGNLDDISKRVLETLTNVDLILAEDTRHTIKILNKFSIKTKMAAYHKFNELKTREKIIDKLKDGNNIALVSDAGTPCISDPGYLLVKLAREEKLEVIGIPGPSAVTTSLSISGLNTDKFLFYGFLSTDKKKITEELEQIKDNKINTIVIYESPKRIKKTVKAIMDIIPNTNIALLSDLTKLYERCFYGQIEKVYEEITNDPNIEKGEYVIVIEKQEQKEEIKELELTLEALLVDTMIKNNCNVKEAINILSTNKKIKKNDVYNASLNLKKIL